MTAYFSSTPFTQAALKSPKIHSILTSSDVMGQSSFLVMGATRRYVGANPKMPDVIARAINEAATIIKTDPKKAAEIYLKYEPSKSLDVSTVQAILKELKDDFGSSVHGVQSYADFMGRLGQLKNPPKSWKEIVTPSLAEHFKLVAVGGMMQQVARGGQGSSRRARMRPAQRRLTRRRCCARAASRCSTRRRITW